MLSNHFWNGFLTGGGVVFAAFFVVYFIYRVSCHPERQPRDLSSFFRRCLCSGRLQAGALGVAFA